MKVTDESLQLHPLKSSPSSTIIFTNGSVASVDRGSCALALLLDKSISTCRTHETCSKHLQSMSSTIDSFERRHMPPGETHIQSLTPSPTSLASYKITRSIQVDKSTDDESSFRPTGVGNKGRKYTSIMDLLNTTSREPIECAKRLSARRPPTLPTPAVALDIHNQESFRSSEPVVKVEQHGLVWDSTNENGQSKASGFDYKHGIEILPVGADSDNPELSPISREHEVDSRKRKASCFISRDERSVGFTSAGKSSPCRCSSSPNSSGRVGMQRNIQGQSGDTSQKSIWPRQQHSNSDDHLWSNHSLQYARTDCAPDRDPQSEYLHRHNKRSAAQGQSFHDTYYENPPSPVDSRLGAGYLPSLPGNDEDPRHSSRSMYRPEQSYDAFEGKYPSSSTSPRGLGSKSTSIKSLSPTLHQVSNSQHSSSLYDSKILSNRPPTRYGIFCRQQPIHARRCGFGEKDRRTLDPPPIIECYEIDADGRRLAEAPQDPFLTLHVSLWNDDGTDERNLIVTNQPRRIDITRQNEELMQTPDASAKITRVLMGSLVASPTKLDDEYGKRGAFFVFPDLSIRTEGSYRLKFSMFSMSGVDLMTPGAKAVLVGECVTDVFLVYSAKKFPGMLKSTEVSTCSRCVCLITDQES